MKPNWNGILVVLIVFAILLVGYYWNQPSVPGSKAKRVAVLSYVTHPVLDTVRDSMEEHINQLAADAGERVVLRHFNADGSTTQIPLLTKQILEERYDLIIPIATPVSRQIVQDASNVQPVVYSFVTNPDDLGGARLEKNVTGVSDAVNYPGNIELIRSMMPEARSIGMLYNPAEANSIDAVQRVTDILKQTGIQLKLVEVETSAQVAAVAANLADEVDLYYIGGDNTVVGAAKDLIKAADSANKPVFASDSGSVENGAVAAISVNYREIGSATARFAWQVLHDGKQPSQLSPVSISGNECVYNNDQLARFGLKLPEKYREKAKAIK